MKFRITSIILLVFCLICCYACGENDIRQDTGNVVRVESNISIVSGIISATSTKHTTTTEVRKNMIGMSSNNEMTVEHVQPKNRIVETTIVTSVTTVDTISNTDVQTTKTEVDYNEVDNSPLIWKNGQQYYVVKAGDSWSSVSNYLGVDPIQLATQNNSSLYETIYPGDELVVPNEYVDTITTLNQNDQNDWGYSNSSGTCLSSVTVWSAPDEASWNNIVVSLSSLNGLQLAPGEIFDWNNYIGWQTVSENYGYMKAKVIIANDEIGYEIGGGVCVTSTALYQAARDAGMFIIERWKHSNSTGVTYATRENEASVSYGGINLIFQNTTGYNVVFYTSCYYGSVTISCFTC